MQLHQWIEKAWAEEGCFRETHRNLTFTDQGLEVGNGTLLVKYIHDEWDRLTLDIEAQEERILALLSVAWNQPIPDGIIKHFRNASRALSKSEIVQACIHLAYAGLPPLERDPDRLLLLFAAEAFLDAGISGNEIRKAWGLGRSGAFPQQRENSNLSIRKDNVNHYPAKTPGGKGGEFAPKDGTSAEHGDNVDKEYIRQKISDALQGKKVIVLVGGAEDAETNGPIAKSMQQVQKDYPDAVVVYFTNDGEKYDPNAPFVPPFGGRGSNPPPPVKLDDWLAKQADIYGSDNIAIIGHSMGASAAAAVVEKGQKVGALITLDGVSFGSLPKFQDVKSNAGTWINLNSNPTPEAKKRGETANFIASLRNKWNNEPDGIADHHYNADINHQEVRQFLLK